MFGARVVTFYLDPARYISSLYLSSQLSYALCTIRIFAANGELYLPERHCLPLFDPRFTSSTPFTLVSRLCLIGAFFRQTPSFAASASLSLSFTLRLARTTLHASSRSRRESPRFISLQTIPASIVFPYQLPLFYQRSPLSLCLCPLCSARTFSPFLFHPTHPRLVHFLDLSSSRSNHRASVSASRTLSAIVFLRLKPSPSVSLQRHSLRRVLFLQPPLVLSLHPTTLSLFLPLAVSHQLTHTLRRRQAPVPCGLVLRARGCCEIIVSLRPSRNQPPRVTPR